MRAGEIDRRLPEVRDVCRKYRGIDISAEPIPVAPSVHFFMGGLAVHLNHETNLRNLYAVGECASIYHGANRLGGNSLLAAIYSGNVAADSIAGREEGPERPAFDKQIAQEREAFDGLLRTESPFPVKYIRDMLADTMRENMSIVRSEKLLKKGIADVDYELSIAERIRYDPSASAYGTYSLTGILTLARAALTCAEARRESRGAHYRSDYPETSEAFSAATLISYDGGAYRVRQDKENAYEN